MRTEDGGTAAHGKSFQALVRRACTALSHRPRGLVADVDGTLSPIVERPEQATVPPAVLRALARPVRSMDLVALLSGRSVAQLQSMVPIDGLVLVGNHGLEWRLGDGALVLPEAEAHIPNMAAARDWLMNELQSAGLLVEDKGPTLAIHYRLSPQPEAARRAILSALGRCPFAKTLKITEGRKVVNVLPPVRADKGTAVERLVRLHGLRSVVYLGDDTTDLDAFRSLRALEESEELRAVVVAVVSPEAPVELLHEADFTLNGVGDVARFLDRMGSLGS